jgi:hypothetical protein
MVKLKAVVPLFPSARPIASTEMVGVVSAGGRQQSVPPFLQETTIKKNTGRKYFISKLWSEVKQPLDTFVQ